MQPGTPEDNSRKHQESAHNLAQSVEKLRQLGSQRSLVRVGRMSTVLLMILAATLALLLENALQEVIATGISSNKIRLSINISGNTVDSDESLDKINQRIKEQDKNVKASLESQRESIKAVKENIDFLEKHVAALKKQYLWTIHTDDAQEGLGKRLSEASDQLKERIKLLKTLEQTEKSLMQQQEKQKEEQNLFLLL